VIRVGALAWLGLLSGGAIGSLALSTACSCPPGQDMVSVQGGRYVSTTAEYDVEVSGGVRIVERYIHDGKAYVVTYAQARDEGFPHEAASSVAR
jgi:hypothetical protein